MDSRIQDLINNYHDLYNYLMANGEISFANAIDLHYKKILVFACASLFENLICDAIYETAKNTCPLPIAEFIRNKAIERQYHTYFSWGDYKASSINNFLGLWGGEFKSSFQNMEKQDSGLVDGILAFIKIGNERNLMAHENFIEYNPSMTFVEVETLYKRADYFVRILIETMSKIE